MLFRSNSRLGGYTSLGESPQQDQQDAFMFAATGHHPLEKITEEQVNTLDYFIFKSWERYFVCMKHALLIFKN